jgi:4'-phosphopantetheinyl transferase
VKAFTRLAVPSLAEDELHIWPARLDASSTDLDRFSKSLSTDERARAARFHFRRDRDRYVAGRGLLRVLLGSYLEVAPAQLRFEYTQHGKPLLPDAGLSFNVSHSGDHALFAFGPGLEVGVDVEVMRREPAEEEVAERFFAASEVKALRALPRAAQAEAFLRCWTRKEAYVKARGDGLSLSLQDFEVTLGPGEPAGLVRTAWSQSEPAAWRLYDLSGLYRKCVAAVAVRTDDDELRLVVRRELCGTIAARSTQRKEQM